ncbi:MAG: hydrolase 1, exosortase A system-associated [Novosphingobium sp.]
MSRRHFTFECHGARLAATLDAPESGETPGKTGLLLVTGGNEVRGGAWNGQARFAARIAAAGFPVLRFDRRGVGDSEGRNGEFAASTPDIAAALATFRRECPQLTRVAGFGNCDAASALMLAGGAGLDALVLSNPWTIGDDEDTPAEVVRDHYRRRLADPAAIRRLLTGQIALGQLLRSLLPALRPAPRATSGLAAEMAERLAPFKGPVRFLIAGHDRTGLAFAATWNKADKRIRTCPGASHSYVEPEAQDWLVKQVLEVLRG